MKKFLLLSSHMFLATFLSSLFNLAVINAQTIIHRDSSVTFLTDYKGSLKVAKVPPAIDFGVIDIGDASPNSDFSHWGNVVLGPDNKFYYAIGDHDENGTVILKSYDPEIQKDTICIYSPDIPKLADGKWHGRPVIDPNTGDMYHIGFYKGQIVKYNIYSKDVTNYGQVGGHGWQEHIWDYKRNRLYGVAGELLVYDTENNTAIFQGYRASSRARMVDIETGIFYSTNDNGNFFKYDPDSNICTKLNSKLPVSLRANTYKKEDDGSFWIFDKNGTMFKFFPDKDSLDLKGANAETDEYSAFIERSPYGNYLYYISAHNYGGHLIQYNTSTDEKKIIAVLDNYYSDNYSYSHYGFFGGALSRDGSSIFLVCNGSVNNKIRSAFFHVHIPESERDLETYVETDTLPNLDTLGNSAHYILSTSTTGKGKVSPVSGFLSEGIDITITATASEGWKIDQWTGDAVDTTNSVTATMNSDVSIVAHFVELPSQVSNQMNSDIHVYPNPVKDKLIIELQNEFSRNAVIQLFDNTGRLIINKKVQGPSNVLDMGDLSQGIYLLKVSNNNAETLIKYIIIDS